LIIEKRKSDTMLLTCEKCQTTYRLDERYLAHGGRVVRCTDCGNTWFEAQVKVEGVTEEPAAEISFERMLQNAAEAAGDDTGNLDSSRAMTPMPQDFEMPVMDDRPGGLGPNAFGASVFFLLLFMTLNGVFLARHAIVQHVPAMALLYNTVGATLQAPGEGLSFSELTARKEKAARGEQMALSLKLSNMSDHAIVQPVLKITLRGPYGAFLKEWEQPPKDAQRMLAPGEAVPLKLFFADVPEGGNTVDVTVLGH
jgi:predicted Zn finger-like uncharacterized protein